jgi:hypothetical protein
MFIFDRFIIDKYNFKFLLIGMYMSLRKPITAMIQNASEDILLLTLFHSFLYSLIYFFDNKLSWRICFNNPFTKSSNKYDNLLNSDINNQVSFNLRWVVLRIIYPLILIVITITFSCMSYKEINQSRGIKLSQGIEDDSNFFSKFNLLISCIKDSFYSCML